MSNIKRWERAADMDDFMNRFARFFAHPLSFQLSDETLTTGQWTPPVDIHETPEAYVITAEIADVKKEDVKVSLNEGVLSFTGERRQEKEEKNKKVHRVERSYGRFSRSFTLPGSVDPAKVAATFKDGILSIQVPKASPAASSREIKIQ
jgi:HSP20 family protein